MSDTEANGAEAPIEAADNAEATPAGDKPLDWWGDETTDDELLTAAPMGDPGQVGRAQPLDTDEERPEDEADPNNAPEEVAADDNAERQSFEHDLGNGMRLAVGDDGTPMVYGVKADGHVYDLPIDELARGYARTAATTRKFQELAERRKHAEGVLRIFQEAHQTGDYHRLGHVLKQVDVDADALFEGWAEQKMRELQMTPEERYQLELRRKDEEFARERKRWEQEQQERTLEAQAAERRQSLERAIPEALNSVGLGEDPEALQAVIDVMLEATGAGYPIQPIEAAQMVRERMAERVTHRLPDDPEELERILGEERIRKLQQRAVSRVRKTAAPTTRSAPAPVRREEREWVPMPDNPDDLRAYFNS